MSGLINIGFGNAVNTAKVVAVINPDAAPVKRLVSHAREEGRIIDATQGRRTKAVIITQEDHIILSALQPETIAKRFSQKDRLVGRGTETADVIHDRLERAAQEAQEMGSYEYIIVNDDLDTCVKQVHELIQSAHCKKSHNTAFIKELQQDMNCFLKGE